MKYLENEHLPSKNCTTEIARADASKSKTGGRVSNRVRENDKLK